MSNSKLQICCEWCWEDSNAVLLACGAIPITISDSKGYIVDDDGIDFVKFSHLRDIKAQQRSLRYKPPPCSR
ncbi:hypothetical protein KFK09_009577 [Dendrobium nobile]|uniref:Glutamate/phenylalanine/leucine/valine/L-tryptophan dehydrogenase C-terminal domain-containing protein n=1 Tax=Dendrobium nobile TaxID=94219 RepID=A0A8T3BJN3_DENNO|nr:hypothetical protein KFK09_009577 [Dendrobium nobile]